MPMLTKALGWIVRMALRDRFNVSFGADAVAGAVMLVERFFF